MGELDCRHCGQKEPIAPDAKLEIYGKRIYATCTGCGELAIANIAQEQVEK